MMKRTCRYSFLILLVTQALVFNLCLGAQTTLRAPPDLLTRVGFDQKLGGQVPLQLTFRAADGSRVRLDDLLDGRPTLLVPGYFGCANLCGAVRAGVAHAIARSGFTPGKQFNVVLVSIDPQETPVNAQVVQHNDAKAYPGADAQRWHYLTGAPAAIAAITGAIGFRYFFDARNGQFDHAAGIVLLTPQGRVAQYLFGVGFAPRTLRLALVAAAHKKIGNVVDRLLLMCCDYDASTGRYSVPIHRVMQGLGIGFALMLCGWLVFLWRRDGASS
jgi:protein SCO1/2